MTPIWHDILEEARLQRQQNEQSLTEGSPSNVV